MKVASDRGSTFTLTTSLCTCIARWYVICDDLIIGSVMAQIPDTTTGHVEGIEFPSQER